jgi:transglutaminase-like putative cysteine protease
MKKNYQFFFTLPQTESLSFFSLPATNQYQTIDNLKINPSYDTLIKDKRWGNKIVVNGNSISFIHRPKAVSQEVPEKFSLKDSQKNFRQTAVDQFINGQDKKIVFLAEKVVNQEKNLRKVIKKLYNFTLEYLSYGKPYEGLYSYKQALEEKVTDCGGFSTLLISLFQSLDLPSRLVVGYQLKPGLIKSLLSQTHIISPIFALTFRSLYPHVWVELMLPDRSWFPLDASTEWKRTHQLTSSQAGFGFIPADRLVTSYGENFQLDIKGKKYKIDLLQKPIYL